MKIVRFILSLTLITCSLSYAEEDKCSNNFKNAVINNTKINQINIVCGDKKPAIPRFIGTIQHETFKEFVDSGFESIDNFSDFIFENDNKIVYIDISPYATCEDRAVRGEELFLSIPSYPKLGSLYGGLEINFSNSEEIKFDFNCMRLRLSGYFMIEAIGGPYQGWMTAALKPIPNEKIYQIYGGEPIFTDQARVIGTTFLQNMKIEDAINDLERAHEIYRKKIRFETSYFDNMGAFFLKNRCALVDASFSSFDKAKSFVHNKMKTHLFANIYKTTQSKFIVATRTIEKEYFNFEDKSQSCMEQNLLTQQYLINVTTPNQKPIIAYNKPQQQTHLQRNEQKAWKNSQIIPSYKCALLVASRTNLSEAKHYLQQKVSDKRYANIYQVKNGRYAISVGLLNANDKDSIIRQWKAEGKIPSDSFCANADFLTKEIKF